jgi:hypothetical protein
MEHFFSGNVKKVEIGGNGGFRPGDFFSAAALPGRKGFRS